MTPEEFSRQIQICASDPDREARIAADTALVSDEVSRLAASDWLFNPRLFDPATAATGGAGRAAEHGYHGRDCGPGIFGGGLCIAGPRTPVFYERVTLPARIWYAAGGYADPGGDVVLNAVDEHDGATQLVLVAGSWNIHFSGSCTASGIVDGLVFGIALDVGGIERGSATAGAGATIAFGANVTLSAPATVALRNTAAIAAICRGTLVCTPGGA